MANCFIGTLIHDFSPVPRDHVKGFIENGVGILFEAAQRELSAKKLKRFLLKVRAEACENEVLSNQIMTTLLVKVSSVGVKNFSTNEEQMLHGSGDRGVIKP